jgi:hypothetical protein
LDRFPTFTILFLSQAAIVWQRQFLYIASPSPVEISVSWADAAPPLAQKVGKMGKRRSKLRALGWLLLLSTLPLMIALLSGCSTVGQAPEATALSEAVDSVDSTTQLAAASVSNQQLTDFARDQITDVAASPHQPRRRTCWKAIHDAFTKPWYGNYLGPDNFGYDKPPIDELDAAARVHDMAYDRCHAAGIGGALWCLDAGKADLELARQAFLALPSLDCTGRIMGVATGVTMGLLGILKEPLASLRDALHHHPKSFAAAPAS